MQNSFKAVVLTSIEYVTNDLRKKWKQFMIGVLTVFLTVSFISFLGAICSLHPIASLTTAIHHAGDIDVMLTGHSGTTANKYGNTNYYQDELEFFNEPFLSPSEKRIQLAEKSIKQQVPTVNFTEITAIVDREYT